MLVDGNVRCWGFNGDGQLGYGNTTTIGDDESPASAGPVNVGPGRTAKAVATGDYHTCALLDDGSVRCWGFGANGRLGYANTNNVADKPTTTPDKAGPVDLGAGRTATAITVGAAHACAILDDGTVRCWGFGGSAQLGYANIKNVGDDETPGSVGPVFLGVGRTARAISAGARHTCALLDDGNVRCWGEGAGGRLGYGNTTDIGDDETPGSVGPVDLGPGRKATAISAGDYHTCALLDDGSVRCWGNGYNGELGYVSTNNVGDNETPGSVGPVNLGPGRTALAISAGGTDTCALLDDGNVRCWGLGSRGRLGYGNTDDIGDNETPGSVGPVNLGPGRRAVAVTAGQSHTCARLDDGGVRCWGLGANGRLGYCSEESVGDDEVPGSAGPVDLGQPGGVGCPGPLVSATAGLSTAGGTQTAVTAASVARGDVQRAAGLRGCLAAVGDHAQREQRLARRGSARRRSVAGRHARRHQRAGRRRCLRRFGRTPGPVRGLRAHGLDRTRIELSFYAPGSDGDRPPAAERYLVKQSPRPIRTERDFARAQTLCHGSCRVTPSPQGQPPQESGRAGGGEEPMGTGPRTRCLHPHGLRRLLASDAFTSPSARPASTAAAQQSGSGGLQVGACVTLTITDLKPHTTYYYAIAARDNVSAKRGPRSPTVKTRTR